MATFNFLPIDYDYIDMNSETHIRMFGKTASGETICLFDKTPSYFWIIPENGANLDKLQEKLMKIKLTYASRQINIKEIKIKEKNYLGNKIKALQLFTNTHKDNIHLAQEVKHIKDVESKREIDINFVTRYIIDKNVKPLVWQKVTAEPLDNELNNIDVKCFIAENIEEVSESKQQNFSFKPKVLALDIETEEFEIGKGKILMLSLTSGNGKFQKVISWKKLKSGKKPDFVEYVKDEAEMIKKFVEYVKKEKPDFITGYFSDGFDLPYLRARATLHRLKLNLGLDNSNVKFKKTTRGINSARVCGRVHIDLFRFINNVLAPNLQSETVSLNQVAAELLGDKKLDIDFSEGLDRVDLETFFKYNLQDSVLAEKLFYKIWQNLEELTKTVQEPVFNISRETYSQLVENYIIHNLKRFNEITLSRPTHEKIADRRTRVKYKGALVKQPTPGLFENIIIFDFRSLYPSIISSFNISPASITEKKDNVFKSPEFEFEGKKQTFFFKKEKSFIPQLIHEIIEKRKKIKQRLRKHPTPELSARDYALKTLMNATYGYMGFFGARYYSVECAASITAFARFYITQTIGQAEKAGFEVIYSDTDSIAITLIKKTKKQALDFVDKINSKLPGEMQLEFEDFYKRGIFVSKRTTQAGAKKKYALINEKNQIKIRGFETVRRDWCSLSKKLQSNIIKTILQDGNPDSALKTVKDIIKKIRQRKINKKQLIIKTQLKKPLSEYKAISPHVVIARKMHEQGLPINPGILIEYFIAESKSKKRCLVRDKAKMPDEKGDYCIDYYLKHQILPAVENIFAIFGIELSEIADGKKQKKLGEF